MNKSSKTSVVHDYDAVKSAIESSSSIREVLTALGLRAAGGNYKALKSACIAHELTLPKPKGNVYAAAQAKGNHSGVRIPDDKVFCKDSTFSNRTLIKARLRKIWDLWQCSMCGLGEMWNNLPITLQLDHINGVYNDHRISNLRLLCPNCHSQTDTYAGKKR